MFKGFSDRFSNGQALGREAFAVMREQPKLLVFPAIAMLAAILLMIGILLRSFWLLPLVRHGNQFLFDYEQPFPWLGLSALAIGGYFALAFIVIFFNSALCGSVLMRHETGKLSLRFGLSMAMRNLPAILGWTLFATTIGAALSVMTSVLDEKFGFIGDLVGSLFEAAWAAMIYFAGPILVAEGLGPLALIKRSGTMLKERWGQTTGGEFSCTWAIWPLHLVGLLLILTAGGMAYTGVPMSGAVFASLASAIIIYAVLAGTLHSVMSGILKSHMYAYALTGQVPPGGDAQAYAKAFRKD